MKQKTCLEYVENYLLQKYQNGVSLKTLRKELMNRRLPEALVDKLIRITKLNK